MTTLRTNTRLGPPDPNCPLYGLGVSFIRNGREWFGTIIRQHDYLGRATLVVSVNYRVYHLTIVHIHPCRVTGLEERVRSRGYVLRSLYRADTYWSRSNGWGSFATATIYTEAERARAQVGALARWVSVVNHDDTRGLARTTQELYE